MKRLFTLLLGQHLAAEYKRNISQIQVLKHGKKFAVVPTNQVKAEKAVEPKVSGNAWEPNQWIGTVQA